MNQLQVGYAQVNINPPLGIGVDGYYIPRYASGFLDNLEAHALALRCSGAAPVLLISADLCKMNMSFAKECREMIGKASGIPEDNIFLSVTHTHTGPMIVPTDRFEVDADKIKRYALFLKERLQDLAVMALKDIKPAIMGFAEAKAPDRIAYIRRYKMKDGSTMTCPPINDPNIDHPIGTLDQRVHVLRFDQTGGNTIVLMNYGLHADTTNGDMISADWIGWVRSTIGKALDGVKCICFIGAEGDVGSTNVYPSAGDMNDTEISFDNEMKSPGMARFVGRALAGSILQVFDKVEYIDVEKIGILHKIVKVAANVPKPEELPLAHKYKELHQNGLDDRIPYTAMELTTVVAEAMRMCELENGPEYFNLDMTGVRIGEVALIGIPGEPFTDIGVSIKDTGGWSAILPCCQTNGSERYFPMQLAFDEGGYEARSSLYAPGVAEAIIRGGKELLTDLLNV